jgi:hypothetical protein
MITNLEARAVSRQQPAQPAPQGFFSRPIAARPCSGRQLGRDVPQLRGGVRQQHGQPGLRGLQGTCVKHMKQLFTCE